MCSNRSFLYPQKLVTVMSQKRQKVGRVLPMTTAIRCDKIDLSEGEGTFRNQKNPEPHSLKKHIS